MKATYLTLALLIVIAPLRPAAAGQIGEAKADCDSTGCSSYAASERNPIVHPRLIRKRRRPTTCTFALTDIPATTPVYDPDGNPISVDGPGRWFEKRCETWMPNPDLQSSPFVYRGEIRRGQTVDLVYLKIRPSDVAALKDEAFGSLPLPAPEVVLSPPADRVVVYAPMWLAVDDPWEPRTSTVSVPGVSVVVSAYPVRVRYQMGNGDVVTCNGPGAKYDPGLPDGGQHTDCSYVYRRASAGQPSTAEHPADRYGLRATVDWQVTWSVVGAPGGGDLGTVSRTSDPVPVAVGEIQTFNVRAAEGTR